MALYFVRYADGWWSVVRQTWYAGDRDVNEEEIVTDLTLAEAFQRACELSTAGGEG